MVILRKYCLEVLCHNLPKFDLEIQEATEENLRKSFQKVQSNEVEHSSAEEVNLRAFSKREAYAGVTLRDIVLGTHATWNEYKM